MPAKWMIRKIAERLINQKIPDLNPGMRAMRREVAKPYLRLLPPALWLIGIGVVKGVYDLVAHPFRIAEDTILLFLSGLIIASLALPADLIVRSRGDN